MFFIYEIINLINNYKYIGLTRRPSKRWREHINTSNKNKGYYLHDSIRKYGHNNFQFTIIDEAESLEEAMFAEIYYISYLHYCGESIYNLTDGGETPPISNIGVKQSSEFKKRLSEMFSGENNPFYGKKHTEENKIKCIDNGKNALQIKKEKMGQEDFDEWFKVRNDKISKMVTGENNPFYGKKHSDASLRKMSEWQLGLRTGEENPFYDKKHTDDTKKIISATNTKLNQSQRQEIIKERELGHTYQIIADKYNVSIQTIANVIKGKYAYLSI